MKNRILHKIENKKILKIKVEEEGNKQKQKDKT